MDNELSIFFMDMFAITAVVNILDYLSKKYYNKTFNEYDPYFFLLFVYIDYLGNRFRNDRMGFLRLVF